MRYAFIFCFLLALIYVIVKLLLEHQESEDKAKGIAQPHEAYTFKGMLKMIREERKERKKEKRGLKQPKDSPDQPAAAVSIRPFGGTAQEKNSEGK